MAATNWRAGSARVASVVGWVAATGREAHELAGRRRVRQLRLSTAEREACVDELAEQYALGRLDEAELGRRLDLLHGAVRHGDLDPAFAGLPMPMVRAPAVRPRRWRWVVFTTAVWLAAPFALLGLVLAVAGHQLAGAVFGLPALGFVMLMWRWASDHRPSGRRGPS